jgi:hypothetical protein
MGRVRRAALAVVCASVLLGCSEERGQIHELDRARCRWPDGSGEWSSVPLPAGEPAGRAGSTTLEVCYQVPPLDVDDPAVLLESADALAGARVGDRPIVLARDSGVLPLPPVTGPREVCAIYRGWYPLPVYPAHAGSQRAVVSMGQRDQLVHFAIGVVLAALGAVLALASLRPGTERAYGWLGLFAVNIGILSVAQSTQLRAMVAPMPEAWRWVRGVCLLLLPAPIALFARDLFGDTRRNWLLRLAAGLALVTGGAALAELLELASILTTRRLVYPFMFGMIAVSSHRMVVRFRAGDRSARLVLVGVIAMVVVSVPNILIGLGLLNYTHVGVTNIGILLFVIALGAALEQRYREQRAALHASTERLQRNVDELEERRHDIEALNEELRDQLERRSRQLREALTQGPRQHAVLADPSIGDLDTGALVDDRYRVEGRLGAGAMGIVYRVVRLRDDRSFALKVMTGVATSEQAARFAREAEMAAKLRHQHLVPLVDVGVARGAPYLVMDLVRGPTLEAERPRFGDVAWGLPLLIDVASGLVALHGAGVLHRDLKPSNVLLEERADGRPIARLADFGVARADQGDGPAPPSGQPPSLSASQALGLGDTTPADPALTETGAIIGTPRYMPPEAAYGVSSRASDVFALGIMAQEVLGGSYPFEAPPVVAVYSGRAMEPKLTVPPPFLELVASMLDPDAARRPSARKVLERLGELATTAAAAV